MAAVPPAGEERTDAASASLADVGIPRAGGPAPGADALRAAYLDLLKLCLADLGGTTTLSVLPTPEGGIVARELAGERLRIRAAGLDWPLQGLTMSGLLRLDDLQECIAAVVRDGVEGDVIEAGSWRGGSSILMRATLDALEGAERRSVWVADSFQGFPSDEEGGPSEVNERLRAHDFLSVSLEEVQANFARLGVDAGVRFVPGFFRDTLPGLNGGPWALIRLDGDSYEATQLALDSLYADLAPGGFVIVDDYGAIDECRVAVDEFRRTRDIDDPIEWVDWTCVHWRRGGEPLPVARGARAREDDREAHDATSSPPSQRVPSLNELVLDRLLVETHEELIRERERRSRRDELLRRLLNSSAFGLVERIGRLRRGSEPVVSRAAVRRALDD